MTSHRRRRARGFTLIELAIVLAIVALLMRVAVPGLARAAAAHALAAQASEFMSALRFARSEAIKRGAVVTLCAALAPASPAEAPRCQAVRQADWRAGWVVFVDAGRSGVVADGGPLLRVQQPLRLSGGVAGTRGSISFTAAGFSTDAASHFQFNAPAADSLPPALLVCVSKQGRPRLVRGGSCD